VSWNLDVDLEVDLDLDVDFDQCVLTPCVFSGAFRMFDAGGGRSSAVASARQAPVQVQVKVQVGVCEGAMGSSQDGADPRLDLACSASQGLPRACPAERVDGKGSAQEGRCPSLILSGLLATPCGASPRRRGGSETRRTAILLASRAAPL